ncbi:cyclin-dependent protein serine/threonine kinase inhibiting protein SIC1 KNAG_0L00130 [Huiozyma naganishii CBS 8797]|uniref:Uncharacterized protein n=1 Tax=Huiozyma naganishii (strain ATCC MYA-139 / BCRC 22969 / CBS 8797 / KCTC 17520 / NBRC 10181 / NCYC 3082 / Yp74L-3) TaxID=1071383 RepID=J7SB09_HUIN7|nr:hypothetical protein KNAG_0L00130 [Kazachstania naganishii CBS 8797]CCK72636.1 hypothetical protein KNAG_0L00130 [Kazachstania naganishii CBS 8797]
MNPATPPRSRSSVKGREPAESRFGSGNGESQTLPPLPKKLGVPPETPQKSVLSGAPVTPSTVHHLNRAPVSLKYHNGAGDLLAPPSQLRSPEFSPMRRTSIGENKSASRVLFPHSLQLDAEADDSEEELLLPASPCKKKLQKTVPGTPSHKVVSFEQAREWCEPQIRSDSDDDEDNTEHIVTATRPANPFMTSSGTTAAERRRRQDALLSENPRLRDTVTYVDKHGNTIKERRLTPAETQQFQPRALFQEELREQQQQRDGDDSI